MRNGRLDNRFILVGLQFFFVAVFLEAVRLAGISFDPSHIFDWSALHFIALAMLVSYLLLSIDKRVLLLFTIVLLVGHELLVTNLRDQAVSSITPQALHSTAWIWSLALSALLGWCYWQVVKYWRPVASTSRIVITGAGVIAIALMMPTFHQFSLSHTRALTNFYNLPSAIFVTNTFDDNYWPLVLCFPLFAAGYFFRDVSFNSAYRRWFPLFLICGFAGIFHLIFFFIPTVPIGAQLTFPKFVFMTWQGMFGFTSSVFMMVVAIYYWQKNRQLIRLEKWAYYSRNIVLLYLIHGPVLRLATFVFPLKAIATLGQTLHSTLIFIWFYVVASYVVSLWLSHVLGLILERLAQTRSMTKEVA